MRSDVDVALQIRLLVERDWLGFDVGSWHINGDWLLVAARVTPSVLLCNVDGMVAYHVSAYLRS